MKLEKRKLSGREKDEDSVMLLEQLRQKLYSNSTSTARRAAFNLSWMQEDGLDILKEALFGRSSRNTKNAAAYGLRNMHGRMKNEGLAVLKQGLDDHEQSTRAVCKKAFLILEGKHTGKPYRPRKARKPRFEIREIRGRGRRIISHKSAKERL